MLKTLEYRWSVLENYTFLCVCVLKDVQVSTDYWLEKLVNDVQAIANTCLFFRYLGLFSISQASCQRIIRFLNPFLGISSYEAFFQAVLVEIEWLRALPLKVLKFFLSLISSFSTMSSELFGQLEIKLCGWKECYFGIFHLFRALSVTWWFPFICMRNSSIIFNETSS